MENGAIDLSIERLSALREGYKVLQVHFSGSAGLKSELSHTTSGKVAN